eukprot:c21439_g1_i1.p1 GENE.c21439_g1_i1~~c21439_g1_i1.p1  ORF type:complete len:491 (+),score=137.95 c21439_g1_i1:30-1502(+)
MLWLKLLPALFCSCLFIFVNGSILTVYDQGVSKSESVISSPAFDLGNLTFPLTFQNVILSSGCSAIHKITQSTSTVSLLSGNYKNVLVMIGYKQEDSSCLKTHHVFECQQHDWCGGILVEEPFFSPPGMEMWSVFDKHRPRSDYMIPLVEATTEDFQIWKNSIIFDETSGTGITNTSIVIKLTRDANKWEATFNSWGFKVVIQGMCGAWSFLCIIVALVILNRIRKTSSHENSRGGRFGSLALNRKTPIKVICLYLQLLNHSFRVIFRVDLFFTTQIYPYLTSFEFYSSSTIFQIVSNLLLAFVLHELTVAKNSINMQEKLFFAYILCFCFVLIDFTIATLSGLVVYKTSPHILGKATYNLILYMVFGLWYFQQAILFFRRSSRSAKATKKTNSQAALLQKMSIMNASGLLLYSSIQTLVYVREIYGNPVGYSIVTFLTNFSPQLTSMIEIFIFGGIIIDPKKLKESFQRRLSALPFTGSSVEDQTSTAI